MALWRLRLLLHHAIGGFLEAGGTRLAAAMAYYALLSLFPLAIFLVAALSIVLGETEAREQVIDQIVGALPLTSTGTEEIEGILRDASGQATALGVAGIAGLLWTASGLMGAIRAGLRTVSGPEQGRPFVLGKLVDLAMVLSVGLLFVVAAGLTVAVRVTEQQVLDRLPIPGTATLLGVAAPIAVASLTVLMLLRLVPAERPPWSGSWRGALLGGAALWALATGFGFYVGNFGRYNAVYGSLGAVVAFMVFVWLASMVLLIVAAIASRYEFVRRAPQPEPEPDDGEPAWAKVRRALIGLVVRR